MFETRFDNDIAVTYGMVEAAILCKLNHLMDAFQGRIDDDGVKWVRMTLEEWKNEFPYLDNTKIWRTLKSLQDQDLIESTTFNSRSKWYRIADETIFQDEKSNFQNEKREPETVEKEPVIFQNEESNFQNEKSIFHSDELPESMSFKPSLNQKDKNNISSQTQELRTCEKNIDFIWSQAKKLLVTQMDKTAFHQWIGPAKLTYLENGDGGQCRRAIIQAHNEAAQGWIQHRLIKPLQFTLAATAGGPVNIIGVELEPP